VLQESAFTGEVESGGRRGFVKVGVLFNVAHEFIDSISLDGTEELFESAYVLINRWHFISPILNN
jgi:hypothetical protein